MVPMGAVNLTGCEEGSPNALAMLRPGSLPQVEEAYLKAHR